MKDWFTVLALCTLVIGLPLCFFIGPIGFAIGALAFIVLSA